MDFYESNLSRGGTFSCLLSRLRPRSFLRGLLTTIRPEKNTFVIVNRQPARLPASQSVSQTVSRPVGKQASKQARKRASERASRQFYSDHVAASRARAHIATTTATASGKCEHLVSDNKRPLSCLSGELSIPALFPELWRCRPKTVFPELMYLCSQYPEGCGF